jgi:hypothetical protein
MVERLIILSDKTITDNDVRAFANPSQHLYMKVMARHPSQLTLTSLKTSRNIKITPSVSTLSSSLKKITGTYQKPLMILISNAVIYTVRLKSTD